MEEQDPPKKRRPGRPKGSKNKKTDASKDISREFDLYIDANELNDVSDDAFQEMLIEALKSASKEKKYSRNCKLALASTLEEFISSYILIGFDFNGNPVQISKAETPMESSALGMSLQKFVASYFSRQYPSDM